MATSYCTILKLDNKEIAISFFTKLIASQILSPILECLSNSNLVSFTAPNTEELTIPSKGYTQTSIYLPEIQGSYIVSVSVIGARTPSYVPQIYVAGFSRQGITDVNIYINLYNAYETSLSNTLQLGIWYAKRT